MRGEKLEIKCNGCNKLFFILKKNENNHSGTCKPCRTKRSRSLYVQKAIEAVLDQYDVVEVVLPKTTNERTIYKVKCESCGDIYDVIGHNLKRKKIARLFCKNCVAKENCVLGQAGQRLRPYEWLYNQFVRYCKKRGELTNKITYDIFLTFTSIKNCFYCESEVNWEKYTPQGKRTKSCGFNLDAKDTELGHNELGNLVVCCSDCNKTKTHRYSHEEFLLIGKVIKQIKKDRLNHSSLNC